MQYTAIFQGCKNDTFQIKNVLFFLIFEYKNSTVWPTLIILNVSIALKGSHFYILLVNAMKILNGNFQSVASLLYAN